MSVAALPFWFDGPPTVAGRGAALAPVLELTVAAELTCLAAAASIRPAWEDLSACALEPSVFLEPAFVIAAALHFAVNQRPGFVLVWRSCPDTQQRQLIGLCPMLQPRFARAGLSKVWNSNQSALGAPLLHRKHAAVALEAIIALFASRAKTAPALLFAKVPQAGPTAALIRTLADATGRPMRLSAEHARACLPGGQAGINALAASFSARQHKEMKRQRRRLEDKGAVLVQSARTAHDVREAIEAFLVLEARGWKGRAGSAFLSDPGQTAFLRSVTRDMARQGQCRVDMLMQAGRPVAMGIVLTTQGSAAFWKTTYDETLANLSPGVQLCYEISHRQVSDPSVASTDSCAIANHPMIDRVWGDRLVVADMLLGIQPQHSAAFALVHTRLVQTQRLRAVAKALYHRLRARKAA